MPMSPGQRGLYSEVQDSQDYNERGKNKNKKPENKNQDKTTTQKMLYEIMQNYTLSAMCGSTCF